MPPPPALVALAALVATATVARAEPPPAARWVGAPVLPAGRVEVGLVHQVLLARTPSFAGGLWEPWSEAIDVAVAVGPRLTLGLSHSARAQGTVDHGGGWCHDVRFHRCRSRYAGGLVDARWRARAWRGGALAALARVGVVGLDPALPVVRLGASARLARGRWWLVAEPEWQISLGHRELGNRDELVAPVWLGVGRTRTAAWLQTGARGQTVGLGEKLEIPLVLGGAVRVGRVRAGLEAGFPKLLGPQNNGNERHAAISVTVDF